MKRFFRIAACAVLMFVSGSGVGVSQELNDVFNEFSQGYHDEFYSSPEQIQKELDLQQVHNQLILDNLEKRSEIISQRVKELSSQPSPEEFLKAITEIQVDGDFVIRKALTEKARELYSDEQYRDIQQRRFQMRESIMRHLESLNNRDDFLNLVYVDSNLYLMGDGQPDFLELTPEQRELITRQQKDMTIKIRMLMHDTLNNNPEKNDIIMQLITKNKELSIVSHDEEKTREIHKQIQKLHNEVYKDAFPELKKILMKSREDFLRVLTDAQKAKIKAVMDEMPDYMKNLFAEIDRQGGGLSILQLWQPGMGAPDMPNPNRESPRKRTQSDRTFPQ